MKALLITEYFPPIIHGGGEISAYALAIGLAKNNIEVHVLTSYFPGLQKYEEKHNIKIHRYLKTGINPRKIMDNVRRILLFHNSIKQEAEKLNKKENFDIIHFLNTNSITNLSNIKAQKLATINGYTNFCPKANLYYKKVKFRPGEKNFTKYIRDITSSEYIGKQKFRFYLKYNPIFLIWLYSDYLKRRNQVKYVDKFIVLNDVIKLRNSRKIYNLANINKEIISFPIQIDKNKTIITVIGALEKIKGVDILIKSFQNIENANLLIVGSGSEESKLKQLCKDLKIENKIKFTESVNQKYIPYIYSISDIIVLPTRWPEPFSRVMLEATFFKKPIIATNVGGNKEGVINNVNGYLINNIQELTQKLEILIQDKKLREKMGEESEKIYKEKFQPEKLLKQIIEFYSA